MVISPGGGGTGSRGVTPYTGVHLEASGNHNVKGGMPPHFWTLYQGGTEAGDEPDDDMVGSGHGKLI